MNITFSVITKFDDIYLVCASIKNLLYRWNAYYTQGSTYYRGTSNWEYLRAFVNMHEKIVLCY